MLGYVWRWFVDLHSSRGSSGFGPNAISWPDIAAYFGMQGIRPTHSELDLIKRLDAIALKPPDKLAQQATGPKLKPGKAHLRGKRKT